MATLKAGERIDYYLVERLLGRGSMGEVWLASSVASDSASPAKGQAVALKVMSAQAYRDPELRRRFEREMAVSSLLRAPHVCGMLERLTHASGLPVMVMPFLLGETLESRLQREHELPVAEVAWIVEDALQALRVAHAAGVVHRDIKPTNLFLSAPSLAVPREHSVLMDFGVSRWMGGGEPPLAWRGVEISGLGLPGAAPAVFPISDADDHGPLTEADTTLGSIAYMAPEQIGGSREADARSDLYALMTVAFRALAGRLPFEASAAALIVAMKVERRAPRLSELTGTRWPEALERFMSECLSKDPDGRPANAEVALKSWLAVCGDLMRSPMPSRLPPPPPSVPYMTDDCTVLDDPASIVSPGPPPSRSGRR